MFSCLFGRNVRVAVCFGTATTGIGLNASRCCSRRGLSERLHAIHGDFLSVDIPKVDALVANVPYQISSPLLQRVFSLPADRQPERSVLLLQKEFVDRMIAQ